MKFQQNFLFNILLFIAGCASVSSPTGGKKDVKAPELVNVYPANKSTNFNGQLMNLEFDELVKVENLKQELLITPALEGDFQTKLTKTGVTLTFDKPFQANTTYTFNFRNTFKDITEKNIAKNVKVVFSTGSVIDTLTIAGKVKDPLKGTSLLDVLVSLYRADDTLTVFKHKPYYSTRTDSSGNFALENLKEGNYRIYAVEDKNNNLKYDPPVERIGFNKESLQLNGNIKDVNLNVVRIDKRAPRINGTQSKVNTYQLDFDEGLTSLDVQFPSTIKRMPFMLSGVNKLLIYRNAEVNDSIPIRINAIDSSGNQMDKEVKIKFASAERAGRQKAEEPVKTDLAITTEPKNGQEVLKSFEYKIDFSKPIGIFNQKDIVILEDTLRELLMTPENFKWNAYMTNLNIQIKSNAKREIGIRIPPGTFISVENDTNKVTKTDHRIMELENYGSITGSVSTDANHFIVELLSSDFKVVDRKLNQKSYLFSYLSAGSYRIRVIRDENANGKWDAGDLDAGILPEEIRFMPDEIKLKQNWDITDINLNL
jgi:uncharacterized protein (DUF2141 family)